jgi:carbon storage regulator CsrA
MLVLGRKELETLELRVAGQVILVHVVRVDGKRVRLGIEADQSVHVVRKELSDKEQGHGL